MKPLTASSTGALVLPRPASAPFDAPAPVRALPRDADASDERASAAAALDFSALHLAALARRSRKVADARERARLRYHHCFALLYHISMQRQVRAAAVAEHSGFYFTLIHVFFDFYRQRVVRRICGAPAASRHRLWNLYFAAAEHGARLGVAPTISAAVLGPCAHVLADLPDALVAATRYWRARRDPGFRLEGFAGDYFNAGPNRAFRKLARDYLAAVAASEPIAASAALSRLFVVFSSPLLGQWRRIAWAQAVARLERDAGRGA